MPVKAYYYRGARLFYFQALFFFLLIMSSLVVSTNAESEASSVVLREVNNVQYKKRYVSLELTTTALNITQNDEADASGEVKGNKKTNQKERKQSKSGSRVSRTIDMSDVIGAMCVQKHARWVLVVFLYRLEVSERKAGSESGSEKVYWISSVCELRKGKREREVEREECVQAVPSVRVMPVLSLLVE